MTDGIDLDAVDWRRIVNEMNVSFGILRFTPATEYTPSDIFLLYANEYYQKHLRLLGYDLDMLKNAGYVGSGSHLDAQMSHDIEEALHQRVQMHDKLYVTSMKRWIDYYITPMSLPGCYYIVIIDIDREQKRLAEVERLGLIDALTNVGNRNALQVALNRLRTQDIPLGVLAADLNNLKYINDEQGHAAGDRAIAETAALLKNSFTDWDIYRFGGDEFVVLAPRVDETAFSAVVRAFCAAYAAGGNARVSVGYAWGGTSRKVDDIMRTADDAMYVEKRRYYQTHDRRHYDRL